METMAYDYQIQTSTYESRFRLLEPDLVFFVRDHHFPKDVSEIDAFGHAWSLCLTDFQSESVTIRRKGQDIPLLGPKTLFIPPFSLIDWRLKARQITWCAYLSDSVLPSGLPKEPVCLDGHPDQLPISKDEIFAFVRKAKESFPIGKIENENSVSLRVKTILDETHLLNLSMVDVARQAGLSPQGLPRAFKKTFDITPAAYRNKMRIFDATIELLTKKASAMDISHMVGFGDVSRFNKQFRRQMNAVPSQFRLASNTPRGYTHAPTTRDKTDAEF